jgi:acyl-coenzyme A thioesterase PaaI-like protein
VADIVAGSLSNRATEPRVVMTVDLDVRLYGGAATGTLRAAGRILRSGRTLTVCETTFTVDGGPVFAISHSSFIASPRPQDVIIVPPGARRTDGRRLTVPLADRVGVRIVDAGVVEVDRHPDVLNPANTIQGGVIALMAEVAAACVTGGEPRPVTELDVRYLSAVREGPARAEATILSEDATGALVRIETRDAGNENRLTSVAIARTVT